MAAALLGACSGGSSPPETQSAATPRPSEKGPEPTCIDGTSAPKSRIDRPAVALKIENSREARPQSGLEHADVVYEEIVEGGITRFLALYHCGQSAKAGPVRSARFDDPKLALPFTKVLGYSGSNAIVEKELNKRSMVSLTELNGGNAFFRVPPGSRDIHSLYANTERIRSRTPKKAPPPGKIPFHFGSLPTGLPRAHAVTVNFTPSNTVRYIWKRKEWWRFQDGEKFMSAAGKQISVSNLLLQQVRVNNSKRIVDPAGNPSPDIELVGRGKAFLFRDGRVVKGSWRIKKETAAPVFKSRAGKPLPFDRGPIWIELVPSGKGTVKGSFSFR